MILKWVRLGLVAAAVVAAILSVGSLGSTALAGEVHSSSDLFYNYYVPPCFEGSPAAALYPCPLPVPPQVGHTFITYQPLMPHEFLYHHHRRYVTTHPDCTPPTRTRVWWH